MSVFNTDQFRQERASWLYSLDVFQQENIMLKNQLALMMQSDVNPDMLEKAEVFQSTFLNKDTVISLLRHDVKEIDSRVLQMHGHADEQLVHRQQQLRVDMEKMELEFTRLKTAFTRYLSEAS